MSSQELVIWSMALGAIASVAAARLASLVARPSLSQSQGVGYHVTVFMLVLILCGVPAQAGLRLDARLSHAAQVLAGPVCIGLSNFWIRGWLNAAQRDRVMSWVLRATALLLPLAGIACLALPLESQLPAAAAFAVAGAALTFWLTVRAWLLGDALAPSMAAGCLLTIPAIGGMYALAMRVPAVDPALQAAVALAAALSNGFTGFALWRRDGQEARAQRHIDALSQVDAVTRLDSGIALVRKLIRAQRRRLRSSRDGAVIAVLVFDIDRLVPQIGHGAVNDVFIAIAGRIQREIGVVNPVGRYYDRCFVSLVEAIRSPLRLRTLGLRVASSLRRPFTVTAASGERVEVRIEAGVGVVHLSGGSQPVEDILDAAQRMAQAARAMPSRTAMRDPATGQIVAVEQARLGERRRRRTVMLAQDS